MNKYNGKFTRLEKESLDRLVSGWTFWNIDTDYSWEDSYYARDDKDLSGRITAISVHDLVMKVTIAKKAGKL